jgi:DNA repair exonuclease SbcCD ATPase subunit
MTMTDESAVPDEPESFVPQRIRLPRPFRLEMRRFSLFEHTTSPNLSFPGGIFCLAGANGLGKSTVIAALTYAITGGVPEPGREFRSAEDFQKTARAYSQTFFRGRIVEEDAEAAEVELEMQIGSRIYRLVRGMFEPEELRELQVSDVSDGQSIGDNEDEDDVARHARYSRLVLEDCGLESFAQIAFLAHFVMLFDERRDLLFWNERALSSALYLTFGLDPAMARTADRLQDEIRRQDSLTRNYNWQASDVRRQLEALVKAGSDIDGQVEEQDATTDREHRALSDAHEQAVLLAERAVGELSDSQLALARQSSELRALRERYDQLWTRRLHGHGHPRSHPVVTTTVREERCSLCGTEGPQIAARVLEVLGEECCPLCASGLAGESAGQDPAALMRELESVDRDVLAAQNSIAAAEAEIDRLEARAERTRQDVSELAGRLRAFEQKNELALLRHDSSPAGLRAVAAVYEKQIEERMGRKEQARRRREEAKARLRPLQQQLSERYEAAEKGFLPRFEELASDFLGLQVDVEPVRRTDRMLLRLSVAGTHRREEVTLSESQRFFVDIALRMALIAQISARDAVLPALFVDTPEGSLDIAYEAKAGVMFSTFAKKGFGLIMTANINTSKLLLRMASCCGPQLMVLERMTEWTTLSEVQAEEEGLFNDAYEEIVSTLESGGQ